MLRQLVCYRRFFPFYLRTPSKVFYLGLPRHNVLSCSSHRCLAQGEVRTFVTMCFVVRSSICKLLHIFSTYFAVRSSIYIFLTCFVVRSSIYIFCALMLLIWVWNFRRGDRWKGISGNDVSYRGTFLLQRYLSQLHSGALCLCCLSLLIAGCWFSDCAFCICLLLPHLFSCLRSESEAGCS